MPNRVCVLVPLALFSLAGCGDDAAPADDNAGQAGSTMNAGSSAQAGAAPGAGAGSGGRSAGGAGGAGGAVSPGASEEGDPCRSASDCIAGLRCAVVPEILLNGMPLGVCGTPCSMDPDCGDGAICYSYSGEDRDKHCVDVVDEDYAACGVADTSVCDAEKNKICLVDPELPVFGICATECSVGAAGDDAGVPSGEPSGMGCAAGQTCIGGQLAGAPADEGICGVQVARGAECGIGIGQLDLCGPEDVCAPDDIESMTSPVHCFEACSRTEPQCQMGACLLVQGNLGYCI